MKEVFLALIEWMNGFTKIKELNLYKSQDFSNVTFEFGCETYLLSISKVKNDGNGND